MGLRACWQAPDRPTVCDSLSLAKAISFAIERKAQVINLSLSGPPDILLSRLLDVALARGVVVVGAFDRTRRGGGFPASHAGVVAVAGEADGPPEGHVVAAPGRDVPTTQPGGRWYMVNGSSYAAAHVSGLYALLQERAPGPMRSPVLVLAPATDAIDACATLLRMPRPCNCRCSNPHEILAAAYAK
jgi:subtilisin family serine protease